MLRSGAGTIVNVSSVMASLGAAQLSDYSASKAAVTAMHKSLSAELKQHPDIKMILVEPGHFCTPLFEGVESPNRFLAPVLEPVDVAKEVIKAIDEGSSAYLAMPLYARWAGLMNVLPVGAQAILRRLSGVDRGMRTFKGRGSKEAEGTMVGKKI